MIDANREILAAAARDAIDGMIKVERWKYFSWSGIRRGFYERSGVERVSTRRLSWRTLLARTRELSLEVSAHDDDGVTIWFCEDQTDQHGSFCLYVFRTPHPREFYAMAVAARSELKDIEASFGRASRGASARL